MADGLLEKNVFYASMRQGDDVAAGTATQQLVLSIRPRPRAIDPGKRALLIVFRNGPARSIGGVPDTPLRNRVADFTDGTDDANAGNVA